MRVLGVELIAGALAADDDTGGRIALPTRRVDSSVVRA